MENWSPPPSCTTSGAPPSPPISHWNGEPVSGCAVNEKQLPFTKTSAVGAEIATSGTTSRDGHTDGSGVGLDCAPAAAGPSTASAKTTPHCRFIELLRSTPWRRRPRRAPWVLLRLTFPCACVG